MLNTVFILKMILIRILRHAMLDILKSSILWLVKGNTKLLNKTEEDKFKR